MSLANETDDNLITEIFADDVLLGRGNFAIDRVGNRWYRRLLEDRCEEYVNCETVRAKYLFSVSIVEEVHKRCGRFLKPAGPEPCAPQQLGLDEYVEISDKKARIKVAQDLRYQFRYRGKKRNCRPGRKPKKKNPVSVLCHAAAAIRDNSIGGVAGAPENHGLVLETVKISTANQGNGKSNSADDDDVSFACSGVSATMVSKDTELYGGNNSALQDSLQSLTGKSLPRSIFIRKEEGGASLVKDDDEAEPPTSLEHAWNMMDQSDFIHSIRLEHTSFAVV